MSTRRRKRLHVITDDDQREALTSPQRLEILEQLGQIGPASVRDLADRLERSSHALHYHVRRLYEVGLLIQTGSRKSGPRDETLYDTIADRLEVEVEAGRRESGTELRAVRAILRQAERDFIAQADVDPDRLGSPHGFTGRFRGRLSRGARDDVMKHIRAIHRIFDAARRASPPPAARVESHTLTMVFVPDARASRDT